MRRGMALRLELQDALLCKRLEVVVGADGYRVVDEGVLLLYRLAAHVAAQTLGVEALVLVVLEALALDAGVADGAQAAVARVVVLPAVRHVRVHVARLRPAQRLRAVAARETPAVPLAVQLRGVHRAARPVPACAARLHGAPAHAAGPRARGPDRGALPCVLHQRVRGVEELGGEPQHGQRLALRRSRVLRRGHHHGGVVGARERRRGEGGGGVRVQGREGHSGGRARGLAAERGRRARAGGSRSAEAGQRALLVRCNVHGERGGRGAGRCAGGSAALKVEEYVALAHGRECRWRGGGSHRGSGGRGRNYDGAHVCSQRGGVGQREHVGGGRDFLGVLGGAALCGEALGGDHRALDDGAGVEGERDVARLRSVYRADVCSHCSVCVLSGL